MKYTRAEHKRFLDLELKSIAEKYCEVLKTRATVLKDNNEIYATMFVKISNEEKSSGQLLLRFKKTNGIPRKNEYFTAVILLWIYVNPRRGVIYPGAIYESGKLSSLKFIVYGKGKKILMDFLFVDLRALL